MVQSSQSSLRSKLLSDDSVLVKDAEKVQEASQPTARVFQGPRPALRNWTIAAPMDQQGNEQQSAKADEHIEGFDEEISVIKSAHKDNFNINTPKWL